MNYRPHNLTLFQRPELVCFILFQIAFITLQQSQIYNESLCGDVEIDQLFYYVNLNSDGENIVLTNSTSGDVMVYNYCWNVEIYCEYSNAIIRNSMVVINPISHSCRQFKQSAITFINSSNGSMGIQVQYIEPSTNLTQIIAFPCSQLGDVGCPQVDSSTVWSYFNRHQLAYTIVIEVIGAILMVFGIYIYRGSIVLIGWATTFSILVAIESLFVFLHGVPDSVIQNILTLTIVCSFLVGYILGYFPKAGIFCMGLWIGLVITLTLNNIALYYISSSPPNLILMIVIPVLSVGFGILILFIKKTFIIFASSLIGSYLCLRALSWYLGAFPNEFLLSERYHLGLVPAVPWQFYLYVVSLLILTAASSALQYWLFKKKIKKTNQTDNLEDHLNNVENNLAKERQNLMEFKNVFQNAASKNPRVLSKNVKNSFVKKQEREVSESNEDAVEMKSYNSEDEESNQHRSDEEHHSNLKQKLIATNDRKKH